MENTGGVELQPGDEDSEDDESVDDIGTLHYWWNGANSSDFL